MTAEQDDLTGSQRALLLTVGVCGDAARRAEESLGSTVRAALDMGIPERAVAESAGISRGKVRRIAGRRTNYEPAR